MRTPRPHPERHEIARIGWLRAAVLGANDGVVSTASLIVGVASASSGRTEILVAGLAGLVAGAMSMAAGEYVSVSSQADTEAANLEREQWELETEPHAEHAELADIYRERGLDREIADEVATQLMEKDALGTHAREELGISEITAARPIQAAITSAVTFTVGAAVPLIVALLVPGTIVVPAVAGASLVALGALGATGARIGGAGLLRPTVRVLFWGALAMAVTAGIGSLVGTAV